MASLSEEKGLGRELLSREQIARRVAEMGAQIANDYPDDPPLVVAVLKGAFVFLTDLVRNIDRHVEVDFIAVSSYGSATTTSGVVRLVKDLDSDIAGRHVLLVEDIVDSGLTLRYLRRMLEARKPASLRICSLLAREAANLDDLGVEYVGFTIGDEFVIGYGLDIAERFRNLDHLAIYEPDEAG